jgi:hypothetical protein
MEGKMRKVHVCLSVRGALNQTKAEMKLMASSITVNGKQLKTADEVRNFLLDELSQGHEVLPIGECDNFDWKTGCKGHEWLKPENVNEQ